MAKAQDTIRDIPFLIVQDYKENRRKCSALPLKSLPGIDFLRLEAPRPGDRPIEVPGGIWLTLDGTPLEAGDRGLLDSDGRVVVFDSTWARVEALRARVRPPSRVSPSSRTLPRGLETAYPRRSKLHADPPGGLATVEAIFAVTVLLGEPRPQVLAKYRWAREFLERNESVLKRFG